MIQILSLFILLLSVSQIRNSSTEANQNPVLTVVTVLENKNYKLKNLIESLHQQKSKKWELLFNFNSDLDALSNEAWLGVRYKAFGMLQDVIMNWTDKIKHSEKNFIYFVNPFCSAVNPAAKTKLNQSGDVSTVSIPVNTGNGGTTTVEMVSKKISLKIMTLNNNRQKINDCLGNPVEIGIAVTWRVKDTAKAVFNVDNYKEYLSLMCDTALRNIVRLYPYDVAPNVDTTGDGIADDGSLRGSSDVVASRIRDEIQPRGEDAGIEIVDASITYLAYATEIAAVMLQRQQASAIIDARKMIVDGAVGMVEMALERLNENQLVTLDEERKAAMVSNLLVVLCGNHDAQPIVNTGSLY